MAFTVVILWQTLIDGSGDSSEDVWRVSYIVSSIDGLIHAHPSGSIKRSLFGPPSVLCILTQVLLSRCRMF